MLYRVVVEQFPKDLFNKRELNLLKIRKNKDNSFFQFCRACGHEYFLEAKNDKDALLKASKIKPLCIK